MAPNAAARLIADVVLPTPPFWLATARRRKPKAPYRRALYRPREPCREFDVETVPDDPNQGKFKLTRRLGEKRRLPFAGLHQSHRPFRVKRRQDQTRKPRAAADIEQRRFAVLPLS